MYELKDYHYDLPNELIAKFPLKERCESRLMTISQDDISHLHFKAVYELINANDLLIFNDTRVIKARLRGNKETGGKVEVLLERLLNESQALAQLKVSKKPKIGDLLYFPQQIILKVTNHSDRFFELTINSGNLTFNEILNRIGEVPLPPYMERLPNEDDLKRYQTIYAKHDGSVAAPTAGLHFDQDLINRLREKGTRLEFLTLHIGSGTFLPVRTENIKVHQMHEEYYDIPQSLCDAISETKAQGGRVIAVGTTTLRALESASLKGALKPHRGCTDIFIYPGFEFKCIDALITNLHLPGSTLLMLVCAFGGYERMREAYAQAVCEQYRFFSYGDAMWITKQSRVDLTPFPTVP